MGAIKKLLTDPKRRQRGSVLSAVLIIVAMLSILVGALTTELSNSFLLAQTLGSRAAREASVNSALELGLYELNNTPVPPVCARDKPPVRGPWSIASLNGSPAAVTYSCTAIVPDQATGLDTHSYVIDGVHQVAFSHDSYLVGDQSGGLRSYPSGSTVAEWTLATGGPLTGPVLVHPDPDIYPIVELAVPSANSNNQCGGHCVAIYTELTSGVPGLRCYMPSQGMVISQPAMEDNSGSTNFSDYLAFTDGGNLYLYDTACQAQTQPAPAPPGYTMVGQPLVYTGTTTKGGHTTTVFDDIFTVATNSTSTEIVHWRYAETTDNQEAETTRSLQIFGTTPVPVGGNAVVSGPSGAPIPGSTVAVAVAGSSGQLALGRITVHSGPTYTVSVGATGAVGGGIAAAPYWCACPGGDTIGVGSTNGSLYLLDTNLIRTHTYDGSPDGSPAINSTPRADVNGDWYFGADDGFVYDVEIPATGNQMLKAARFLGQGGVVRSSPIVVSCSTGPCIYFGSTSGGYFVQLGSTRILELHACVTSAPNSVNCVSNPQLWARAEVGLPSVVGGKGFLVQGWSYYSPSS